jgi:hypothetical protein
LDIPLDFKSKKYNQMKKLSIVFVVFSICFVSCNIYNGGNTIKGDGNIIKSEKTVSSFDKVRVNGFCDVIYHASSQYSTVVSVDSNLLDYVEISTSNNTLKIRTKDGSYSFTKFEVDVYCPQITEVSISGSGSFNCADKMVVPAFKFDVSGSGDLKGTFECDNFSSHISGSGDVNARVECKDFSSHISGSGDVSVSGNSKNSTVHVSGSGNFNGKEFKTNNASLHINGSGDVYICVEDSIIADISGSGNITYSGNPKIDISTSGSGRIKNDKEK